MTNPTRRRFFQFAGASLASTTFLNKGWARAAPASERVRVGIIGCGNQGTSHVNRLKSLRDVEIIYVSDIDSNRLASAVKQSGGATGIADFRRMLDDATIDAVTIATPDHWHVPAALLALSAGKHVYVEKPCSHNVREGRLLMAAVRSSSKVLVHGTQSRSSPAFQQAMSHLRDGVIGDVLVAKCWNCQRRDPIGRKQPSPPPAGIDYDTWVGPAEWLPFQENRFHYNWHWWHNFGCGDLGNDGIHELDYALWGLGVDRHPTMVSAIGGKYFFDDDQQFPDTQQVTFEFVGDGAVGRKMLVYEQRLWSRSYPHNVDSGVEYFGTKGSMFLSKRGKFEVRDDRNQPVEVALVGTPKGDVAENFRNWLSCIRSGGTPHANIDAAHRAATAVHLGNIATRLQRSLKFNPLEERILDDREANDLLARNYRSDGHWAIPRGI